MDTTQNLDSVKLVQPILNRNNLVRIYLLNFIKEELNNKSNNKTSVIFSTEKSCIIIENIKIKKNTNESNDTKVSKETLSDSSYINEEDDDEEIDSSEMSAVEEINI